MVPMNRRRPRCGPRHRRAPRAGIDPGIRLPASSSTSSPRTRGDEPLARSNAPSLPQSAPRARVNPPTVLHGKNAARRSGASAAVITAARAWVAGNPVPPDTRSPSDDCLDERRQALPPSTERAQEAGPVGVSGPLRDKAAGSPHDIEPCHSGTIRENVTIRRTNPSAGHSPRSPRHRPAPPPAFPWAADPPRPARRTLDQSPETRRSRAGGSETRPEGTWTPPHGG